jgi:hypothetical protein
LNHLRFSLQSIKLFTECQDFVKKLFRTGVQPRHAQQPDNYSTIVNVTHTKVLLAYKYILQSIAKMSTPEAKELNLLNKVELRIALADSDLKLEAVLKTYLAPLLLKLASEHVSVRNKVRISEP